MATITTDNQEGLSLAECFDKVKTIIDSGCTPSNDTIKELKSIHKDISSLALFSSNESIDDISTQSLPLLSIDYYLAMSYLNLSTTTAFDRRSNIKLTIDSFSSFFHQLEQYNEAATASTTNMKNMNDELNILLSKEQIKDYHELVDTSTHVLNQQEEQDSNNNGNSNVPPAQQLPSITMGQHRETKIARYKYKQTIQKDIQRLNALNERRQRLNGISENDEMDGYDQDSLLRTLYIRQLALQSSDAIDEWYNVIREIPMISMMIQREKDMKNQQRRQQQRSGSSNNGRCQESPYDDIGRTRQQQSQQPLKLTHITKDITTGQLNIRKEEIKKNVFKPSWNQPTMSLEELGDIERKEAIQRDLRQKELERQEKLNPTPKRYDQLVKDGLEDNADLVDASAKLDRKWDAFKDENPRGSGNKMGDRGDRNF